MARTSDDRGTRESEAGDGSRSADDAPLEPGTRLGDYVIEAKIGSGGMGDVFLGVHHLIRKRAAIKLLRGDASRDETAFSRFVAEARLVNEIGHPNIVDVFAFGAAPDGRHFLAMEYLQGETLRSRLARGPLGVEEAAQIARPLVRALIAAHAKGVVHRDLKPDNVFLHTVPGETMVVKLLDFGIAKLDRPDENIHQTASGAFVGTPMYIAPEQARGQPVDARSDVYTLGGMLFEMVAGRPPFLAATAFEVVAKHLTEVPPRPSQLARIPRELDTLIVSMLAKGVEDRPSLSTVLGVLDGLAELSTRPTSELDYRRDSTASLSVTSVRRAAASGEPAAAAPGQRRPSLAVAAVGALVIVVAVLSFVLVRSASTSRRLPAAAIVDAPLQVPLAVIADAALPVDAVTSNTTAAQIETPVQPVAPDVKAPGPRPHHKRAVTSRPPGAGSAGSGSAAKRPCDPYRSLDGC